MSRRVVISGLGTISGLGVGMGPAWEKVLAGQCVIGPIQVFDPSGFDCRIASEVTGFRIQDFVPKSHRKAAKVMARDIELAVAAANLAARDAQLVTRGTAGDDQASVSYPPGRMGAHIGAALIAAELNELTEALARATDERGNFDYHRWGSEGMSHLSPLWLLKYLPNMLACHVTIVHDAQGPSNTITCGDTSGTLSVGESLRVIQRGGADLCFCGGAESKLNPMAFFRQHLMGRLNVGDNDQPERSVRPFDSSAAGTVLAEAGAIVILESLETFKQRLAEKSDGGPRPRAYAEVVGFGASQTVHRPSRNLKPDPQGKGIALAIRAALREANLQPRQIDLIIPYGSGIPEYDQAEAAALRAVFGEGLSRVPVTSVKGLVGNAGSAAGGLDVAVAARTLDEQMIPATVNCDEPIDGLGVRSGPSRGAALEHALVYSTGLGGQNAAVVLKRIQPEELSQ